MTHSCTALACCVDAHSQALHDSTTHCRVDTANSHTNTREDMTRKHTSYIVLPTPKVSYYSNCNTHSNTHQRVHNANIQSWLLPSPMRLFLGTPVAVYYSVMQRPPISSQCPLRLFVDTPAYASVPKRSTPRRQALDLVPCGARPCNTIVAWDMPHSWMLFIIALIMALSVMRPYMHASTYKQSRMHTRTCTQHNHQHNKIGMRGITHV